MNTKSFEVMTASYSARELPFSCGAYADPRSLFRYWFTRSTRSTSAESRSTRLKIADRLIRLSWRIPFTAKQRPRMSFLAIKMRKLRSRIFIHLLSYQPTCEPCKAVSWAFLTDLRVLFSVRSSTLYVWARSMMRESACSNQTVTCTIARPGLASSLIARRTQLLSLNSSRTRLQSSSRPRSSTSSNIEDTLISISEDKYHTQRETYSKTCTQTCQLNPHDIANIPCFHAIMFSLCLLPLNKVYTVSLHSSLCYLQ